MDPDRIQKLTDEVLSQLGAPGAEAAGHGDLEARVAALERAVFARPQAQAAPVTIVAAAPAVHASHHVLRVLGGTLGEPCILEPDKPCEHSHRCRTLGF